MAIRIARGTAPQPGRITMPQGTFLSNPSTAADGGLGGSQGMNPAPGWNGSLGYSYTSPQSNGMWWTPQNTNPSVPSGQWYSGLVTGLNNLNRNFEMGVNQPLRDAKLGTSGQFTGPFAFMNSLNGEQLSKPNSYVSPFSAASNTAAQSQYGDMPTANDYGAVIPVGVANNAGAADGMSAAQVAQQMQAAGYTQKWVQDLGQVWVKGGSSTQTTANPAFGGATDTRGRPEWVDGAALAPNESVVDSNGNRYVGGTPAPDGTPQYALNLANPSAARDTKGRYKWVSEVRKDSNGNWVRINRQVLRKVYTRSHLKKKAAQREAQSQNPVDGQNYNQLVNLRVNYG